MKKLLNGNVKQEMWYHVKFLFILEKYNFNKSKKEFNL